MALGNAGMVPRLRTIKRNSNTLPTKGLPNRAARRRAARLIAEDARLVRVASADAYRRHGFRGFYTEHAAYYAVEQAARRLWRRGVLNRRERFRVRDLMRAQRTALANTPTVAPDANHNAKVALVVGAVAVGLVTLFVLWELLLK